MKALKIFLFLIFIGIAANAQLNYASIIDFNILPEYLVNGKIRIDPTKIETTIKYRVKFSRMYADNNTSYTNPSWKTINMSYALGAKDSNGALNNISSIKELSHASFSGNSTVVEIEFTDAIRKNDLVLGQKIGIIYTEPMSVSGVKSTGFWSYVAYDFQIGDGSVSPPSVALLTPVEGNHYAITDGRIFVAMDGTLRHVQTMDTYAGLFVKKPIISKYASVDVLSKFKIGLPIGGNTNIFRDINNGKVYYMEDGVLRHILSPDVANKYQFKLQNVTNISSTNGYTIGSSFY